MTSRLLIAALALGLSASTLLAGTWTRVTRNAPGAIGLMLLLPDGSVMANGSGASISNAWYRLRPDIHGSYTNGTWSSLAPMQDTRLYFSSAVLQDGRVFIAGGEYGTGGTTSEVYDPVANTWTVVPVPAALLDPTRNSTVSFEPEGFYDACSKILANGNVMVAPVAPHAPGQTMIFQSATNTWTAGPNLFRGNYEAEASWVKLPDQTILTIDPFGQNSERYNPATNTWINDGTLPVALYDPIGSELGAGFRLADGRAFFLGATGHTALYIPTATTAPGTWVAGADIPAGLATPDAPAAMMVTGNVLCAVGPKIYLDTNSFPVFPAPTSFYEYDPVANSFTRMNAPVGTTDNIPPYVAQMLDLPDGTVLYSHGAVDAYVYVPTGAPLAAGKPTVAAVSPNPDGSFHLTGTGLNGISEGAAYGDDAQMDTNYPIVRLTDASNNVYYARTFNWSSTGVATGALSVSTDFALPFNAPPGPLSLVAVANGIASDPFAFQSPGTALISVLSTAVSDSTGNGNNNGRIDPGESSIGLNIQLRNLGTSTATDVIATLDSNTPTVSVVTSSSSYPDLVPGFDNLNAVSYAVAVDSSHPCGSPISLTLHVVSNLGASNFNIALTTGLTGAVHPALTINYTGAAVPIPDNSPAGVMIPISVTGLSGLVSDVKFRINGASCNATANSTTVGLSHTWIGDVSLKLVSPSGTIVTLMDRPGSVNNFGVNFCQTTLSDAGASLIQGIAPGGNPWTGTFKPASPLAAFAGENGNGTWGLIATDGFPGDTGTIRTFSVIITTREPSTCDAASACTPVGFSGSASSMRGCRGTPLTLTASPTGTPPFIYQWRKDTTAITGATSASLMIAAFASGDIGSYDCTVTNACGPVTSPAIAVSLCNADYNCSGTLEVQDIFDFLNAWFAADARADFNGNGLSVADIFDFLNAWFAGCS